MPTAVIERCNDLFNFNPKISLSEDTCNTFTEEDKELKDFADGFRVVATSTELAIRNLSDAAQSRFSVIYTTSYTQEERDLLIQIYYENTPKEFYDFLKDYNFFFKKDLSFLYVTKILNILKLLDSKFNKDDREKVEIRKKNLCLAIHLSLKFIINNNQKKIFKKIINKIIPDFYKIKNENEGEEFEEEVEDINPFVFSGDELQSNWSNLSIVSCDLKDDEDCNLAFIKPFNKLLEHIFLSIAIHYPLIIEGGTGKGRKSAIYYFAKILGYNVIYFNISNSTTVDDLFCKKMPVEKDGNMAFVDIRSLLLDGIDANIEKDKNCIIILDNLQQANSNVLESLIPLFDINAKSILVQGEEIIKRSYNLFGIIDSSESKSANDFLPESIKYSAILYKNSKYLKREYCRKIIDKMFGDEVNIENEPKIEYYLNCFIKLNNYVVKKQIKELFTFNDFKKLLFFLKNSRTDKDDPKTSIFDILTITQLLLVYKFKSKDEINSANEILGNSLVSDFWPIFSYSSEKNKDDDDEPENGQFQIAPDNKGENLCYPLKNKITKENCEELLLKTHSLSPDQRRGIIFLMLSALSDVPCVIQGITASGKTHLIRLFCELLGQKPLIIDINNDTGISILLKQLVPKEKLEEKYVKKIKKNMKKLINKERTLLGDEIEKIIDINNSKNWLPSQFRNLLDLLEEKIYLLKNESLMIASELKTLISEQLSFFKHLSNEDSSFIKAMINGDWVILDGIESAQPELYQRISSLCDLENQNLTMYDNGPEYVYKKDAKKKQFKIHKDFRLFITYNPFEVESSKRLPQSFLNKCLTFSLSQIDENIKTTSLVLSGSFMLKQLYSDLEEKYYNDNKDQLKLKKKCNDKNKIIANITKEDLRTLGLKFAKIHHYSNELALNNKGDFAGKKIFSGRSIKFILNVLETHPNDINEGIISVIQDIYCYPYKKSQTEFKKNLIDKFVEPCTNELMQFLRNDEVDPDEKYKIFIDDLTKIKTNPEIDFDMNQFIKSTFSYKYKDIPILIKKIEECLSFLDIENIYYTYLSLFRIILKNYLTRRGSDKKLTSSLKKKSINDLALSKEDEYLRVPQNLLFIYQELLAKNMIKKISYIDYEKYSELVNKNKDIEEGDKKDEDNIEHDIKEKEENLLEESKEKSNNNDLDDNPLDIISKNEKLYIKKKSIQGKEPFLELCFDESDLVGSFATLTIGYPELNDMSLEELDEMLKLEHFNKKLFMLLIILFNNSEFNNNKRELFICQKLTEFLEDKDFIDAIQNTYNKEELLKDTDLEKDSKYIEKCEKIKEDLYNLTKEDLEFCKRNNEIIKTYFNEWNDQYDIYLKDLDEAYYKKIGQENILKNKNKIKGLINKLNEKSKNNESLKYFFNDMIEYLKKITKFNDETYSMAEIQVNNLLKDSESYNESTSKTIFIHFPIKDYDDNYKPQTPFQKIYTLLMDYTDSYFLINSFKKNPDSRTCMNLGKLKKYLKIQENTTIQGLIKQFNILYEKIMKNDEKVQYYINNFEVCILSNLLMDIYNIKKEFLNNNLIKEKLNNYCKRNIIEYDNEKDLIWASFLSKTREPFDEIIIPEFTPVSIIKLFTLKNEKNQDDEGIYSTSLMNNNNKTDFYKQINKLYSNQQYIQNKTLTIQTIFEIAMGTLYTDNENISNVDEIQSIFKEKFVEKAKVGEVDIIEIIKEIREKINVPKEDEHKEFLSFIIDLFHYLSYKEEKNKDHLDDLINLLPDKKKDEEGFSEDLSKSFIVKNSIINNSQEKNIELMMDDIFFIKDANWKNKMKAEYKTYPSLLYFLFKYPECEEKLREFLIKTDSIKNSLGNQFPTFLLILRIFSSTNCLNISINTDRFFGIIIKDEILLGIKSRSSDKFKNSPDINWLGLLINTPEVNKYLSPKMNYIYNYLENICKYSVNIKEENKKKYKNVIHNMIDSLFKIIFEGNLDSIFTKEIPKKINENISKKNNIENILYFTKLPEIIYMELKKENQNLENKLYEKFKEEIKNIKEVYNKNKNLYKNLMEAIENDAEVEKKNKIEDDYRKERNILGATCEKNESNYNGYIDNIKRLKNAKLNLIEYNQEIKNILKCKEYLEHKNNTLFTNECLLSYGKIEFKEMLRGFILKIGDLEEKIDIDKNDKNNFSYYINPNSIKSKQDISVSSLKYVNVKFDYKPCNFYQINEKLKETIFQKEKNIFESYSRKDPNTIKLKLIINNDKDNIDITHAKNHINFKNLESIMGEGGIKKQLARAFDIINNKEEKNIKEVISVILEFEKIFKKLEDLEFQTPKFADQIGTPKSTIEVCEKYKTEFKDMIIGKLESLIKEYKAYNNHKKGMEDDITSFDTSFSITKFDKHIKDKKLTIKESNKLDINSPYISLSIDSDIPKLQFGYSCYNLTIGPIISSFYEGEKFVYNIISFVNKNLTCELIFEEEKMDDDSRKLIPYFSKKSQIPSTEPIPIIFNVPSKCENKKYTLKGHLEIKTEDNEIKPLLIQFTFNVIFIPLEVYFISENRALTWNEDKLCFKNNSFTENDIIKFKYIIRNYYEDYSFLKGNYYLKSQKQNQVDKNPDIIYEERKNNIFSIKFPLIKKKQELLSGLFNLNFTNDMIIPLELSGPLKKAEFKVFYYNFFLSQIDQDKTDIYIYKHNYKTKDSFNIDMNFRIQTFDKGLHSLTIRFPYDKNSKNDIHFEYEENNKITTSHELSKKFKGYVNINLKANFLPSFRNNLKSKEFCFLVDGLEKKFLVNFIVEPEKLEENDIFVNFLYKAEINHEFKKIEKSNINDVKNTTNYYYSPYSVKFFRKAKNIINIGEVEKLTNVGIYGDKLNLIVIMRDFNNIWVPNDKYFGDEKFDKYKCITLAKENIDDAKKGIAEIFNDITKIAVFNFYYENIKETNEEDIKKYGDFVKFIYYLIVKSNSLRSNLDNCKKIFLSETGNDFESLRNNLELANIKYDIEKNLKNSKKSNLAKNDKAKYDDDGINIEFYPIVYYNIIIQARKILKKKYDYLKKYKFDLSKIKRSENKKKYEKNIVKCFPPYDEEKFNKEVDKLMKALKDEKKASESISDTWLFKENEPKPLQIQYDKIEKNDKFIMDTKKEEGANFDLNLDILKIKDLSNADSLDKIISILKNGYSVSQALMLCIGKLEKTKRKEIFNYLFKIYKSTKESTNSILSKEIELFTKAFENLCRSLNDAGVDLTEFKLSNLKGKDSNMVLNEQKPEPILCPFETGIKWKGNSDYNRYDREEEDDEAKIKIEENIKSKKEKEKERKKEEDKRKKNNNLAKNKEKFEKSDKKDGKEELGNKEEEEKDEKIFFRKTETIVELKPEAINELKLISDENSTDQIVKRMIKGKKEPKLNRPESFLEISNEDRNNIMVRRINNKEEKDASIEDLYILLNNFSKNLYLKFLQQSINFDKNEICAVIGIDICRTIDKKFKLFHTLIATALANCFNSIEIPYSIVVFCDYNVQFVIKDFDEPHDAEISQLIFDAIMVPRNFTRIADACYFISEKVNCKNRVNKKIFIISNGLDTKLKIGEKWPFFNNEKEKFCFYFVKPDLKSEDLSEIVKIWDDFREKTNAEVAAISMEDILNSKSDLYEPFKNIMKFKIYKDIEKINKRNRFAQPLFKEIIQFRKVDFKKLIKSINSEIILSKEYFVQNRIHIPSKGKYQMEDIKVKNPFLSITGKSDDPDYTLDIIDKETKSSLEKLFAREITSEMKLEYIEFIFTPNKPSMFSPSNKGTRLYLIGLINFCITHGQDNKIWLEKNKGYKKDYRATVIIDSSVSCFNDYMRPHSIKTVLAVLRMLSLVEIPFFDLIIATKNKPIVLSCGNDTTNSLNAKSNLWSMVLEQLTENDEECNLLDCLKLAYKLKSVNNVKKYYTFVLTDGMFDEKESEEIQDYVSFCEESNIDVFGIGLGYYPEGIQKIFNKCIWSSNPFMILKALCIFFGNGEKHLENIPLISFENQNNTKVLEKFTTIINRLNSYQEYKDLYGYLDGLKVSLDSLEEITNPDKADEIKDYNPDISDDTTMCEKGAFEGFKILIGMFWSQVLSDKESKWVDKKYLLERYTKDKECLKEVLDYYSIKIVIKEDYKACIEELKTGNYYAHWIICGDGEGRLPNGGNPNLVGQYIDALKIFWVNGGSLVFWNDNYPLTYECNLFLDSAEFPGDVSKTKVKFVGNNDGKSFMFPGDISTGIQKGSKNGKFINKRRFSDGKNEIFSLAHNLIRIAEGTTVSYAQDPENIAPFQTFGYEHQGGKNILFYIPHFKYNHGYLILEGGFTKLFNELDTDGTKRYVLNISAFTTQFTKRNDEKGENWKTNFKLRSFDFKIDESVKIKFNKGISSDFDIIYLLDATGSMGSYLAAARDNCINISNQLKSQLPKFNFNFGAVLYRDPVDCKGEKNKTYPLTSDVERLKRELGSERASGGGDTPEDWVGAYDMALNNIAWRNGTRLIIHIADAPAHGSIWYGQSNHDDQNAKLYPLIKKAVEKKIKIIGFQIGDSPKRSFAEFEKEYKKNGGQLYKIYQFRSGMNADEISKLFRDMVVQSTHAAAPK